MIRFLISCLVISAISWSCYAETRVSLTLPAALELMAVDQHPVNSPSLVSGSYQQPIAVGTHRLTVKYLQNWNNNDDGGQLFESERLVIDHHFLPGKNYQLTIPPLNNAWQAEAFARQPTIWLSENSVKVATAVTAEQAQQREKKQPESVRLKQMKLLWQQASPAEQRRFRHWLNHPD